MTFWELYEETRVPPHGPALDQRERERARRRQRLARKQRGRLTNKVNRKKG